MLQAEDLGFLIGGKYLFKSVNFVINPTDRIGLAGPNGAGKSTLLKLINGHLEPDEGAIHTMSDIETGYLPQDGVAPETDLTVFEEVKQSLETYTTLFENYEDTRRALEKHTAGSAQHTKALNRFGELQEQMQQTGAYSIHATIQQTLHGLGFSEEDWERPVTTFSGGWLMRIALAKLLIKKPEILLLDEPTNHLDIGSLDWLETFLDTYEGAIMVVSHDRAFLNNLTNRTFFLSRKTLQDYAGNYAYFEKEYAERKEQIWREYENQQKEIKHIQEFIDRFRYKSHKAAMVQSRVKKLEKMDKIEPPEERKDIHFEFQSPPRSGAVVVECKNLSKSYEDNQVFKNLNLTIDRGDRIAIVGPNGAGKSTFLKIIAGQVSPDAGTVELGHGVTFSYFAQHQVEELNVHNNLIEELQRATPNHSETNLRSVLGCFLFTGDDVFKKVGVLSGGEKSRVALAKMMVQEANLLIMDEPTNHLDMQSKKIMQEALALYDGTFVIVSHDRDFLDPLVKKVLEIDYNSVSTFHGNVSYYLRKKHEMDEDPESLPATGRPKKATTEQDHNKGITRAEERRIEAKIRKEKSRKLKSVKQEMEPLEARIEELEKEKEKLETNMSAPDFYDNAENVKDISRQYEKLKERLNAKYYRWEQLAEQAAAIEEEYTI